MEKKVTTYGDLKIRKAELQREMLGGYFHNFEEYKKLLVWIKQAESMLLWSILSLILMFSGCAKVMQGTGLIFEGVGDGVVVGGQHLQESASK